MRSAVPQSLVQRIALIGFTVALPFISATSATAQDQEPDAPGLAARLVEAVGAGTFEEAGELLSPDVVVTYQTGDVSRGRPDTVKYVKEMFNGKTALVQAYSGSPTVSAVTRIDDTTRVVTGTSTDQMTLSSGAPMVLETRWTATIALQDGAWKIASLHLSTNMLDNPIIEKMKTTSYLLGAFGFVMGITIGIGVAMLLRRRAAPARSAH